MGGNRIGPNVSFLAITRPSDQICVVTLNRPERMNAMAFDVMLPLRAALEEISVDNTIRSVVLTGAGRAFCSGADLEDPGMVPNIDHLGLANIARRSMGLLEDVVRTGVWLADPRDFWSFNKVFSEYFSPEHAPARACVQANMMVDCKVEIDCVAYKKKA